MTVSFRIEGTDEDGHVQNASMHHRVGRVGQGGAPGMQVYTTPRVELTPALRSFTNDTYGSAMNQAVAFTGNATVVHAGVNSGAALTGTTTGTTASHLIDSGETFSGIEVGMSVKNTTSGTEYALVTAVASNDLTLDADILVSGEDYEINPIWVGSAVSGTWDFAAAGKVTITSANNNDEALFENDTNQQWDVANFSAITIKVDLDTYNGAQNDIMIKFDLNGVAVGDTLGLNDYIDTGDFSEQTITIPIEDFNFATSFINCFSILITRSGGARPTIKFDDIALEATTASAPITFEMRPIGQEILRIDELQFNFQDAYTGIATVAGATENHNGHYLSADQLLGVAALSTGITLRRQENNDTVSAISLKQMSDFLKNSCVIVNYISDTTDTFVTLSLKFKDPVTLFSETQDVISITINDDLSGLTQFTAIAKGNLEAERNEQK